MRIQYRLNSDELMKLCIEKGWSIGEVSKASKLSRVHIWQMTLNIDNPKFSPAGEKARKKLKQVFPNAQGLFLPIDLQSRKKG
jgi:hypothetical protein